VIFSSSRLFLQFLPDISQACTLPVTGLYSTATHPKFFKADTLISQNLFKCPPVNNLVVNIQGARGEVLPAGFESENSWQN